MKTTSWAHTLRLFVLLILACFGSGATRAAGDNEALTQEQVDAFKPMMCGVCLTGGELRIFREGILPSVVPSEAEILGQEYLLAKGDVVPKTRHVCMGRRQTTTKDRPIGLLPADDKRSYGLPANGGQGYVPSYFDHPAKFDGVCLGTLLPIEEFLKLAVGNLFIDQLMKSESLLSSDSLNQVVKDNLSAAFESKRAQMTAQITADVVARLKKDSQAGAQPTPGAPMDGPIMCQMVKACTGAAKPTATCCSCMGSDFNYRAGVCEIKDGKWYLKKP